MNSNDVKPNIEALPEERRLTRQAKSGDADAFVQLYDAYVERIYRYVYFRVINDAAAEDITSQVFRNAWEHFNNYQNNGSSFITWIFEIARKEVTNYYETNLKTHAIDVRFLSVASDYGLDKEVQDLIKLENMRNHMRFLTVDPQQTLISKIFNGEATNKNIARIIAKLDRDVHAAQVSTLQTVAGFLEYLNLGREVKPSPTFNTHTRIWLTQYLQFHARRPKGISMFWRMSMTYIVLIAALLVTGTAKAQSALPGELLYGWKRTSEQAWRSLSPDPVGTDIILANRRLNEWLAVENDPARSAKAMSDYFSELTKLKPKGDEVTLARINTVLKAHRQRLNDSGLSTAQLDNYLTVGANPIPSLIPPQASLTGVVPPATEVPTEVAPPATKVPVEVAPPATVIPTEVLPTATEVPTEVVPPATEVPTAPPATEAPTEIVPPATEVPTDVVPPATEVPTDAAPPATDAPTEPVNPVVPTQPAYATPTGTIP